MSAVRVSTPGAGEVAVATLVIDRPERRNALDDTAAADIARALGAVADSVTTGSVRAVVVTGAATAFCAGRDITGVDPATEDAGDVLERLVNPAIRTLATLPVPTVAAVEGPALGVGLGLALACDLVVAGEGAKLGSPFGRLGAVLDSGAHLFLTERIGRHRTLDLVYTGRLLGGKEALMWGLVDRCVPTGQALASAHDLALGFAVGPTQAFAATKRVLDRIRQQPELGEVLLAEAREQRVVGRTSDYAEGFAAFGAKRAPTFTGE